MRVVVELIYVPLVSRTGWVDREVSFEMSEPQVKRTVQLDAKQLHGREQQGLRCGVRLGVHPPQTIRTHLRRYVKRSAAAYAGRHKGFAFLLAKDIGPKPRQRRIGQPSIHDRHLVLPKRVNEHAHAVGCHGFFPDQPSPAHDWADHNSRSR